MEHDRLFDLIEWDPDTKCFVYQTNEQFTKEEKTIFKYMQQLLVFLEKESKFTVVDILKDPKKFSLLLTRNKITDLQCIFFGIFDTYFRDHVRLMELVFDRPIHIFHRFRLRHKNTYGGENKIYTKWYDNALLHMTADSNFLSDPKTFIKQDEPLSFIRADERLAPLALLTLSESDEMIKDIILDVCDVDLDKYLIGMPGDNTRSNAGIGRKIFTACMYMIYGKNITDKEIAQFLSTPASFFTASGRLHIYRRDHQDLVLGNKDDVSGYVNLFGKVIQRLCLIAESKAALKPAQ
jgi:hypothetical protein